MAGRPIRRALGFLLGFFALFFLAALALSLLSESGSGLIAGRPAVAVVPLEGEIRSSDDFVETVRDLADDASVAGVVVRIDSPGGEVAPSQEMYAALRELRRSKPVVASLGAVAASGGYYVASAADVVVASPGTLTGSIGVIMMLPEISGLLDKVGIRARLVTAGRHKDMGTPFRPLTAEERRVLQQMVDQVHAQFIRAVAEGRGMDLKRARELGDGRIMTGEQARAVGLVDELGGLRRAVAIAAERGGIEGEPRIERREPERRPWWWRALFSEEGPGRPLSAAAFLEEVAGWEEGSAVPYPRLLLRLPFLTQGFRS